MTQSNNEDYDLAIEARPAPIKTKKVKSKKAPSRKPATFDALSPDLPKNLLSINPVVDDKGRPTGQLLVKAIDRRENEIHAVLEEKELALGRCDALVHLAVQARLTEFL